MLAVLVIVFQFAEFNVEVVLMIVQAHATTHVLAVLHAADVAAVVVVEDAEDVAHVPVHVSRVMGVLHAVGVTALARQDVTPRAT